ncbi:class II aldolase/adducin family protein [Sphingobium nicotianae]|uniref:Class II aldolase/adducin family protein n=1 Tax=Sphingobium nicotianae TaxID=2782607 RepID=A0A9X1ISV7_9SPHN|nr:class II aldolase/adducin family protein [Sphingobium nicotianae]MBT2188654.1 class II aldolase/adducin family protein [Sphingobium nicotianae]
MQIREVRTVDRRNVVASALAAAIIGLAPRAVMAQTPAPAQGIERAILDLVIANRILADQEVVDAYGHVSMRHPTNPDRFLLSRSRSPEQVQASDIVQFGLDGSPVTPGAAPFYIERFIHAAIYAARPDVKAVVHAHAAEVLPFTISKTPLQPVIQNAGVVGSHVPVWDSRAHLGDTNLLVSDIRMGTDLAQTLGNDHVVLMRGHGFAAAGRNLIEVLRMAIYLRLNAKVLTEALKLGPVVALSEGEIKKIADVSPNAPELQRAWIYWATKAGCADLLER